MTPAAAPAHSVIPDTIPARASSAKEPGRSASTHRQVRSGTVPGAYEHEQAGYLSELLTLYEEEGIDTAFWFSFANYDKPRRADPGQDLDLASYGLVAVPESGHGDGGQAWVPKEAFTALARHPHQPQPAAK